jgi:hypothetical protein
MAVAGTQERKGTRVKETEIEGHVAEQVWAEENITVTVESGGGMVILRIVSVAGPDIKERVIGCTPRIALRMAADMLRIAESMLGSR